jgi:hypothetical protein
MGISEALIEISRMPVRIGEAPFRVTVPPMTISEAATLIGVAHAHTSPAAMMPR